MQQLVLFGIPIPEGAVRLEIRPVFPGRGGTLVMYKGLTTEDLTDTDIIVAVSRFSAFWEYVEAQVQSKRLERPADGVWSWKLRVTLFNGEGAAADPILTAEAHTFYCATKRAGGDMEDQVGRLIAAAMAAVKEVTSASIGAIERVGVAVAVAHAEAYKANAAAHAASFQAISAAHAETMKASAGALAEASKQTQMVSDLAGKLHEEGQQLKETAFVLLQQQKQQQPQGPAGPRTMADELKEVVETVKVLKSLGDTFEPAKKAPPAPPPAPPKPAAPAPPVTNTAAPPAAPENK